MAFVGCRRFFHKMRRGCALVAAAALCASIGLSPAAQADSLPACKVGSRENPYIITSERGLLAINDDPYACYRLGCDIFLPSTMWKPLCQHGFSGVLDGAGHVIKGLIINSSSYEAGLFHLIGESGIVENLGIEGSCTGRFNIGAFCGRNDGTITKCYSNASVECSGAGQNCGGIAGENFGSIDDCYNTGVIGGLFIDVAGGITGENNGSIRFCYNTGSVQSMGMSGGITGGGCCYCCHFLTDCSLLESGDDEDSDDGDVMSLMQKQSTYAGWDFDGIWHIAPDINGGLPCFISAPKSTALKSLSLSAGTLSPAFSPDSTAYTVNVENSVSSVTVTPVSEDGDTVLVNGKTPKTPVALSEGANTVTVSVTADDGSSKTYTITVTRAAGKAALKSLSLSAGTLSPAFSPDSTAYTANVENSVSSVTVTPTTGDGEIVLVNGKTPQTPVALCEGANIITVSVTADDGSSKTYTIAVTRAAGKAALKSLSLSAGTLSPAFSPDSTAYTANVENSVSSVTVTPVSGDGDTVLVNGKTPKTPVVLCEGTNIITVSVIVDDDSSKTYTIAVTRAAGKAALKSLSLSAGTLSPAFSPNPTAYTANVENSVSSVTVMPVSGDGDTVLVNGKAPQTPVALCEGANSITVRVAADDGSSKTYTITVTRAAGKAALKSLSLSAGTLSPAFSPDSTAYTANVENSVLSVTVTPTAIDGETVLVNGKTPQTPVALCEGTNIITVRVTADDGSSKTYTITVTRAAGKAALKSLSLTAGTLSPAFSPNSTAYTANVENSVSSVTVTPVSGDGDTVLVNGKAPQTPVALCEGANTITVSVTADDDSSKTYTITVTRAYNTYLKALSIGGGGLSPAFNPYLTTYTMEVDNSVSCITVMPAVADANAAVLVNGRLPQTPVQLCEGVNTVVISVTAPNGASTIYVVFITRDYPSYVYSETPDSGNCYSAQVPGYIPMLKPSGRFLFLLGRVCVNMPVGFLQSSFLSGGMISQHELSPDSTADIAQYAPKGVTVLDAFSLGLTNTFAVSDTTITLNLDPGIAQISSDGEPEIYFYDAQTHEFTDMGAYFDLKNKAAFFNCSHFGTFVVAAKNLSVCPYHYSLQADSTFDVSGKTASFNAEILRSSDSAVLYGARVLVVTTKKDGRQKFSYITPPYSDDSKFTVTVDSDAVTCSLYLMKGSFTGERIPQIFAGVLSVQNKNQVKKGAL